MAEERNNYQIARKDAKNCFVESLNDSFPIGRVHFAFATYDVNRPAVSVRPITSISTLLWMSFWTSAGNWNAAS